MDDLKVQFEVYQKTLAELEISKRHDLSSYSSFVEYFNSLLQKVILVLDNYSKLCKIQKKKGDDEGSLN